MWVLHSGLDITCHVSIRLCPAGLCPNERTVTFSSVEDVIDQQLNNTCLWKQKASGCWDSLQSGLRKPEWHVNSCNVSDFRKSIDSTWWGPSGMPRETVSIIVL